MHGEETPEIDVIHPPSVVGDDEAQAAAVTAFADSDVDALAFFAVSDRVGDVLGDGFGDRAERAGGAEHITAHVAVHFKAIKSGHLPSPFPSVGSCRCCRICHGGVARWSPAPCRYG